MSKTPQRPLRPEELFDEALKLKRELAEKTNEASNWHQHYRDEASKAQKCKQAFIEQEKEVARLRGLLKDHATFLRKNGFTREAAILEHGTNYHLATAPEEPVIQDSRITEPEWRELGEDEVICEGDEVQPRHHFRDGEWCKAFSYEIGEKAGHFKSMRYRTLRPLPKQEEMPLEDEIAELETGRVVEVMSNGMKICENPDPKLKTVATCIRYLRDEIQKLKENK